MISSSIHAEMPQNFFRNARTGCAFVTATSLYPDAARRVSTSAWESPMSGLTCSADSVSGTDADAIPGGLVEPFPAGAGRAGAGSTGRSGVVGDGVAVTYVASRFLIALNSACCAAVISG